MTAEWGIRTHKIAYWISKWRSDEGLNWKLTTQVITTTRPSNIDLEGQTTRVKVLYLGLVSLKPSLKADLKAI